MDTQKDERRTEDYGDESLNTASTGNFEERGNSGSDHKGGIHNNALYAASMGRPATAQVDPHSNSGLANTGTNISYEGPTAPGAGGSSGTGYTSGQADTGQSVATSSDYDQAGVGSQANDTDSDEDLAAEAEDEINEQR